MVWDGEVVGGGLGGVVGGGLGGFGGILMMVVRLYGLFTVCILRGGFGYFVMEVNGLWVVANHADTSIRYIYYQNLNQSRYC